MLALLEQSSLEILAKETMLVLLLSGLMPEQITQQLGVHRTTGRLQIIVYGDPTKDIDIYIYTVYPWNHAGHFGVDPQSRSVS